MNEIRTITEPGIYFDLEDEIYHASPGLSASGVKEILISPCDYWAAYRNPDREKFDTAAHVFGKALHRRRLEGAKLFSEHYAVSPDMKDYPDALTTTDQLKLILKKHGYELGGTKTDKIRRVLYLEPETVIWEEIVRKWKEENEHDGKVILTADQGRDIEDRASVTDRHPDAAKAFSGGLPEVSIFWDDEETGLRMKIRIDYLKSRSMVDLKSFTNTGRRSVDDAIGRTFATYSYYIQPYIYQRGLAAAKDAIMSNKDFVVENCPDDRWLASLANHKEHDFWFVFVESGKAPNVRVRRFAKFSEEGTINLYWSQAEYVFGQAVSIYREFIGRFPDPTHRWIESVPASTFKDEDFPLYMID